MAGRPRATTQNHVISVGELKRLQVPAQADSSNVRPRCRLVALGWVSFGCMAYGLWGVDHGLGPVPWFFGAMLGIAFMLLLLFPSQPHRLSAHQYRRHKHATHIVTLMCPVMVIFPFKSSNRNLSLAQSLAQHSDMSEI
eukprot:g60398.t1